jgi:tRNA (guanine37-N1)-methyltransferase
MLDTIRGVKALKVAKREAQRRIDELRDAGLYDHSRKVVREGGHVWLPVTGDVKGAVEKELPELPQRTSLKEEFGIGSFDLVGDIAIVFVPDCMWGRRQKIGKHLLEFYPHVKAVYARSGAISGEFRLPELELVAGEGSETVHREHGLEFFLDVHRAYFSPRQGTERMELTGYVRPGERVAVFFAGIGPIPVYFSRFTKASEIFAIEANPDACRYMEGNVKRNGCANVKVICGDVRARHRELPPCDLVVLPLPKGSEAFVDEAAAVLKPGGRAIFYVGSTEAELDAKLGPVKERFEVQEVRRELEIGPAEWRFVIHARRK